MKVGEAERGRREGRERGEGGKGGRELMASSILYPLETPGGGEEMRRMRIGDEKEKRERGREE